jgi:tripartite-type tricarboxylate transporter receptor subunit TctC
MTGKQIATLLAALATLAVSNEVRAQTWPARPITMVVPFAAGASSDILARIFAPHMSEVLGKPVIIENMGGAGGMTGATRIAKAPPDGYQVLVGSSGTLAINQTLYKNPPYNAATDFAPIALLAEQPIVLIARNDMPANNLKEFIAYVKANEAKLSFASAGAGTTPHLGCLMMHSMIGVNVTHIPYRGLGLAIQDMIAGQTNYQCSVLSPALPQIQGGLVKPIAILTGVRATALPAIPTAKEEGLADLDVATWHALVAPKGTPAAIVNRLNEAVVATMMTPTLQARMHEQGADLAAPERRSPAYLQKYIETEIEKWAKPIRAAGLVGE